MEKFVSLEAKTEYARLLSKRVIKERLLLPTKDVKMVSMIDERGWALFCEMAMEGSVEHRLRVLCER